MVVFTGGEATLRWRDLLVAIRHAADVHREGPFLARVRPSTIRRRITAFRADSALRRYAVEWLRRVGKRRPAPSSSAGDSRPTAAGHPLNFASRKPVVYASLQPDPSVTSQLGDAAEQAK